MDLNSVPGVPTDGNDLVSNTGTAGYVNQMIKLMLNDLIEQCEKSV